MALDYHQNLEFDQVDGQIDGIQSNFAYAFTLRRSRWKFYRLIMQIYNRFMALD